MAFRRRRRGKRWEGERKGEMEGDRKGEMEGDRKEEMGRGGRGRGRRERSVGQPTLGGSTSLHLS